MANRYRASNRREHGCCWGACVEDTDSPVMIGDEHYEDQYEMVCECENLATAERIAAAMNAALALSGE